MNRAADQRSLRRKGERGKKNTKTHFSSLINVKNLGVKFRVQRLNIDTKKFGPEFPWKAALWQSKRTLSNKNDSSH